MLNARARDVKALGAEVKQRAHGGVEGSPIGVDDRIVDLIERRARHRIAQIAGPARLPHITQALDVLRRNAAVRRPHRDRARVIVGQVRQLLGQVGAQQMRLRQLRGIRARLIHVAKRLRTIDRMPIMDLHRQARVDHLAVTLIITRGENLAGSGRGVVVEVAETGDRLGGGQGIVPVLRRACLRIFRA